MRLTLHVSDCFRDQLVESHGKFWGCSGASRDSATINMSNVAGKCPSGVRKRVKRGDTAVFGDLQVTLSQSDASGWAIINVSVPTSSRPPSGKQPVGKEIVFEFSKPISSKANTCVSKLVKLLGGKRSYIEDQTKLVVVM